MATHQGSVTTDQRENLIDPKLQSTIAANLAEVRSKIDRAAGTAGRNPRDIKLIAVSKTFSTEYIRAAVVAGQKDFGENRIQEALPKIMTLTEPQITWHCIGHLQSNKARKAVTPFSWVHSVDSLELLHKLDTAAYSEGASPNLLVQVDLAGEPTKHGATTEETRRILAAGTSCRSVRLCGLMLLPPPSNNPEEARPYLGRLREFRDELLADGTEASMLKQLSMGMSNDFEVAIEEGATMIRVGHAIFGERTAESTPTRPAL